VKATGDTAPIRRLGTRRTEVALSALAALMAAISLNASLATAAACPNEALRIAQGATTLPGCMALELVSPPKKDSQPAFLPSFSREGERVQMKIEAALAGSPGYQHFGGDTYVASRGAGGWITSPTTPPDPAIVRGGGRAGNPALFTPDLSRWAQFGSTQPQVQVAITRLFAGGLDGSFEPLSPLLVPIDDSGDTHLPLAVGFMEVSGAAPDLGPTVFRLPYPSLAYFPEDPRSPSREPEVGNDRNSYLAFLNEAGEPTIELLARDKDDVVFGGRCGAHLGGEGTTLDQVNTFNQGAISPDGDHVFFSTRPAQPFDEEEAEGPPCETDNGLRVFERLSTPEGPAITELAPGGGGPAAPGDDLFQGASADATKVYFTSPRKLTASDTDASAEPCGADIGASKGCDLWLYDATRPAGDRIVHVSAGEGPGGADVFSSVATISGDGSRVYFVAQGALTADTNPEGQSAVAGQPNLYLYEAESTTTSFIGVLSPGDQGSLQGGLWSLTGSGFGDAYAAPLYGPDLKGGGDGHVLAFASKASLTANDQDGGKRDVYRYDATSDTLELVSVDPDTEDAPRDVTVNPAVAKVIEFNFNEATRWMSEDGETIAFATAEPLVAGDTNETVDPYVWKEGQLGYVPALISEPPAVSPVGGQLAFATQTELLPADREAAQDVYVAREGGGFPEPPPAAAACDPLQEGSCQKATPATPSLAAPATAAFSGPGNRTEPAKCRKPRVKRRGRCVKPRKGKARKRADRKRGGRR
jgi:hypothetical protein